MQRAGMKPKTAKESDCSSMSVISSVRSEGGPPLSLEIERRRTMRIVHRVEKEVEMFKEKVLKHAKTQFTDDMNDFVQFIMERAQAKRYPRNNNDFLNLLSKTRDAAQVLYKTDMEMIEAAIETFNNYKDAIRSFKAKLTEALEDHVGKYCHSFASETGPHDISSVQFYENNITAWRGQMREAFALLNDIMGNIKDISSTFELFLSNYGTIVHYMGLSMEVFPRMFDALKDWVTADEAYPRRLQDDISELKREKLNMDNVARRNRLNAGGIQSKVTRSRHHSKKLKEKLLRAMDERRQCRKRELSLLENINKMGDVMKRKKRELDKTLRTLATTTDSSRTSVRDSCMDSSGRVADDIARLEKDMGRLKMGLREIKMNRTAAQKEAHRMQVLFEKNSKLETDIQDDADDATQDARYVEGETRVIGEKVMALIRIRSIKLNPNTLKVIYNEGYSPGRKFDCNDILDEACKLTALDIGKDWPSLYQKLPFSPDRDDNTRMQDIRRFDTARPGPESHNSNAAYRSLERWKRISHDASISALTRTLRSIKKQEVAKKVQKKVITVN